MLIRLFLILMTLFSLKGWSQDVQYSQFYANPLYLNPALAGGSLGTRFTVNYRNQWPAISANFVTSSFGADMYLPSINSGVGVSVMRDTQGEGVYKSTDVGLHYAYQLKLNEENFVRMGLQGGFSTRSIDYFGLTFGDQYSSDGYLVHERTGDNVVNGASQVSYADFGAGIMAYSDWYWLGVATHHINRPSQSFTNLEIARLPMKTTFQAGLRIPFAGFTFLGNEIDREKTISPAIIYKKQGKYDQLDVGMYVTYAPIVFGAWYRGIPIKKYNVNINNHESLIGLIGFRQDKFSIGYSYDATISTLGAASGGAHEISLSYILENFPPSKHRGKRKQKQLSCPKF